MFRFLTYGFVSNIAFIVRLTFKCIGEEFFSDQIFLDSLEGSVIPSKIKVHPPLQYCMCAWPPQVASYFGHSVAVTDVNGDG